jgi:hypothetical protein
MEFNSAFKVLMQHFCDDNDRILNNINNRNLQLVFLGDHFQESFSVATMNTAAVVNDFVSLSLYNIIHFILW